VQGSQRISSTARNYNFILQVNFIAGLDSSSATLRYDLLLSFSEDGNSSCRPVYAWWPQWWKLHGHLCLRNFNHTCTRLRGCRCAQFLSLVRRLRLSTKIPSQGARFNPAPSGLAKTRMSRCTNKVEKMLLLCVESTTRTVGVQFQNYDFIMRQCRWEKACAMFGNPGCPLRTRSPFITPQPSGLRTKFNKWRWKLPTNLAILASKTNLCDLSPA
jgi:hypothetical protein